MPISKLVDGKHFKLNENVMMNLNEDGTMLKNEIGINKDSKMSMIADMIGVKIGENFDVIYSENSEVSRKHRILDDSFVDENGDERALTFLLIMTGQYKTRVSKENLK